MVRGTVGIKSVYINNNGLVIKGIRKKIEVLFSDIKIVRGSVFFMPELIVVNFSKPTEFGDKIVFAGNTRLFGGWSEHPVVHELNALIKQSQMHSTST